MRLLLLLLCTAVEILKEVANLIIHSLLLSVCVPHMFLQCLGIKTLKCSSCCVVHGTGTVVSQWCRDPDHHQLLMIHQRTGTVLPPQAPYSTVANSVF